MFKHFLEPSICLSAWIATLPCHWSFSLCGHVDNQNSLPQFDKTLQFPSMLGTFLWTKWADFLFLILFFLCYTLCITANLSIWCETCTAHLGIAEFFGSSAVNAIVYLITQLGMIDIVVKIHSFTIWFGTPVAVAAISIRPSLQSVLSMFATKASSGYDCIITKTPNCLSD